MKRKYGEEERKKEQGKFLWGCPWQRPVLGLFGEGACVGGALTANFAST